MSAVLILIAVIYVIGFVVTFWINATVIGNLTPGLLFLRSVLWPIWLLGGVQGVPMTMD